MSVFDWIINFLQQIVCWIETGLVDFANLCIAGIAAAASAAIGLLPDLPAYPTAPTWLTNAAGWVAWVFPVHQAVLVFAFLLGAWLVWLGVSVVLRWVRAVA